MCRGTRLSSARSTPQPQREGGKAVSAGPTLQCVSCRCNRAVTRKKLEMDQRSTFWLIGWYYAGRHTGSVHLLGSARLQRKMHKHVYAWPDSKKNLDCHLCLCALTRISVKKILVSGCHDQRSVDIWCRPDRHLCTVQPRLKANAASVLCDERRPMWVRVVGARSWPAGVCCVVWLFGAEC